MSRIGRWLLVGALLLAGEGLPRLASAQMGPGGFGGGAPSGGTKAPSGDLLPEVDEKIANDPDKVVEHANKAFAERDWLEAIAYYRRLRVISQGRPSLSSLAELRLGDIAFEREHWAEATAYYKEFLTLHPRDERADYAAYRLGMCAYKDIPSDFFIEPPSYERDQTEVRAALNLMTNLVQQYPNSKYVPEAKQLITKCQDKLAAHELYVARFYESRKKWNGVVLRAEGAAKDFPASTLVPEALLLAIRAHVTLDELDAAQKDLDLLVANGAPEKIVKKAQAAIRSKRS